MPRRAKIEPLTQAQWGQVTANLRLVDWYLRHKAPPQLVGLFGSRDDAFQVCVLGLMRAVQLYDPAKGKFAGYAVGAMRSMLLRHAPAERGIRHPAYVVQRGGRFYTPLLSGEAIPTPALACEPDGRHERAVERVLCLRRLLYRLDTRLQRRVARLILAGFTERQIADKLGCTRQNVNHFRVAIFARLRELASTDPVLSEV